MNNMRKNKKKVYFLLICLKLYIAYKEEVNKLKLKYL